MSSAAPFNSIVFLARIRALAGHDDRNYSKYSSFVAQQLKQHRKLLFGSKKGFKYAKYKKRTLDDLPQEQQSLDQQQIQIEYQLLVCEKAVADARVLEEQYNRSEEPRHRYHMIRRLRKAIKEGLVLVQFLQNKENGENKAELVHAVSIVSELEAELYFKQEQHEKALYLFSCVRKILANITANKKMTSPLSKAYNSVLSENQQIIRFSAYRLDIPNARSDSINSICESLLKSYKPDFEPSVANLSEFIEISEQPLEPEPSTDKTPSKFDTISGQTFGLYIHDEVLKAVEIVPEITTALESQNKVFTEVLDTLKPAVHTVPSSCSTKDVKTLLQGVADMWTFAILNTKKLIPSDTKAATKYCQFNYSSIMALQNLISASLIYSTSTYFVENCPQSASGQREWWNITQPDKKTVIQTLISRQATPNQLKTSVSKPKSKGKKAGSRLQAGRSNLIELSTIPKLTLYLDNLSYHLKACHQISSDFKVESETDIINYTNRFCTVLRDTFVAYSLLQPNKIEISEAKQLLTKAQKGLDALSKLATKVNVSSDPQNVFELIAASSLGTNSILGMAQLGNMSEFITKLTNYARLVELSEKDIAKTMKSTETILPHQTSTEMLLLYPKPTFYDLAGEFIDFDLNEIAAKAGISQQQEANSFKISSIFSSFLGR